MATPASSRLRYLDWLRGLAAVIMLQGHVFHSFTRSDLKESGPYVLSQWAGGMPPAVFLFLTGITLAFLMYSQERKAQPPHARLMAALKRGGYLFAMAFLFRLQLWAFSWPYNQVTDLLRVDILNCMGFAIVAMSGLALLRAKNRIKAAFLAGCVIAAASPLVSQIDWSRWPSIIRDYLNPSYQAFAFFPWAAFLAFGIAAGTLLKSLEPESIDRAMQWAAIAGVALIYCGQQMANVPYSVYAASEFWLNGPWLVAIKLGVILVFLPLAYLWSRYAGAGWSWLCQLGTASLLVYWVHIELVYGRWVWFWKDSLDAGQAAAASVLVILLMVAIATIKSRHKQWLAAWGALPWYTMAPPKRVPGD